MDADKIFASYVESALWSSTDDEGTPLDSEHDDTDLATETLEIMREDVEAFVRAVEVKDWDVSAITPEQMGHDFWLTRNHHGAGFWDRGLGRLGDDLTTVAQSFGECDLYVGDDGWIYL